MAVFNQFEILSEDIAKKVHDFQASGDTLRIYLSNAAPSLSADEVKADLAEITTENGYTGPADVANDISRVGSITSVTGVDVTFTASGGSFGPVRYVVLMNDTPTSPLDPLIGYWDNGTSISVLDGNSFKADFGTSLFTID